MDSKILNIVRFTVTDRVGVHATDWELAAIFYEDGRMQIVSVDDAIKKANQARVKITTTTPEMLSKNLENYRKVFEYEGGQKEKKEKTISSTKSSSKKNKKSIIKSIFNRKKKQKRKKKKRIFRKALDLVVGVCGGIAMGAYGKIEQLADWLTVHVVRKFDKKKREKSIKDNVDSNAKSVKERAKEYIKRNVADRKNKKKKKKSKIRRGFAKRVAAALTAFTLALGLGSCANPDTSKNTELEQVQLTQDELQDLTDQELLNMINSGELSLDQVKEMLVSGQIKNDLLDNLTYDQLLQVTNNEVQQVEMIKVGKYLDYFNGTFANKYLESNHATVRAALTWEEVNAINLAYNDFTKEDIKSMFNGEELSSADFTSRYKEATLQLMGAFVLETRDAPVNLDSLLDTEDGRKFYQKYNELFLNCKETKGQEQLKAVQAFYQELYKDFPIDEQVREVGISHSQTRDGIDSYKLSITPMVAAAEKMFQNLEVDYTLSNKGVTYFNDLGLCEFAQGEFERAEQITLLADEDKSIPTYKQFMDAEVKELTADDIYFVSDENRDISQYDLFQKWVNGHFNLDKNGNFVTSGNVEEIVTETVDTYSTSSTTYNTKTKKTETSDRNKAVAMAGEDAVRRAESVVNKQFDEENEANKTKGEVDAVKNQHHMQEEADKKAEEIRGEIAKDNQDLQDKIEDANDNINQGGTVNEGDLGHGGNFDDEYSNDQGDLDNSVDNITTDGSGAGEDLPDQNETGAAFDKNQPYYSNQPDGTFTVGAVDGHTFIEYEKPTVETYTTNEAIADAIVENMALNPTAKEEAFVYTK